MTSEDAVYAIRHARQMCLHHAAPETRCNRCNEAALETLVEGFASWEQWSQYHYDGAAEDFAQQACVYAFFVGLYGGAP